MTRIGLALVGLGKIARDQHLPSLAANPAFQLVATASPAESLTGIPAYADLDAALDAHPQIQAVALCTPPAVRAALARRALQRGCHVLLEKPPCVVAQDLAALDGLAATQGLTLFAAWHSRYAAAVETARRILGATPPLRVQVRWKEDHRVWHPGQAWLWREGGFGVLDPGINALSILTHILPAPLEFIDAELDCPQDSAMPAAARISLRSGAAGVAMQLDFLHAGEPCWDIVADTAQGQLVLSQGGAQLSLDGRAQRIQEQSEYAAIYTYFENLIRRGARDADGAPLEIAGAALRHGRRRRLPLQVLPPAPTAGAAATVPDPLPR
ncbi:Gfo/Idh/MocA family protein [Tahibacter harae]|uniref:Gfo/Idh/MocA family oxidoreductase n=1 Tax=Tahibacter harae TaxID=2963937 RepID=A0ABT1QTA3_9GAMM|nr:Gfo/Idh/MocA family oxidoreductase [Tahibacter harae]MCQ4165504.1 Gfo/Idh/MocA family oxidoreductase [Tahibacter harae]